MHAIVRAADVQDRDGGALLMASFFGAFPFLVKLYADGGYQGPEFQSAINGFWRASTWRSSSGRVKPQASSRCPSAGSSNGPWLGSVAADDWPRTGNASTTRRSPSCASAPSASCCENYAIAHDVLGQTLTFDRRPPIARVRPASGFPLASGALSIRRRRRVKEWSARIGDDRRQSAGSSDHGSFGRMSPLAHGCRLPRRSGGNTSGTRTRPRPKAVKTNPWLCNDDPKSPAGDPGERREKHCSGKAVWRPSPDDRQMEGAHVFVRRAHGPEKSQLKRSHSERRSDHCRLPLAHPPLA